MNGIIIGLTEMFLFFLSSSLIKISKKYSRIDVISYYWFMMTILTMIWEISFISNYNIVIETSENFITDNKHVWESQYDLSYILPWKLSVIFYSEYGAYADREYMLWGNNWSRIIEGSHAILCGFFALIAISMIGTRINKNHYLVSASISMGSQLMNSILYMSNYFLQMKDPDNVNYISNEFPAGVLLYKRPFMYVNIFWTIMPIYVLYKLLYFDYDIVYKNPTYKGENDMGKNIELKSRVCRSIRKRGKKPIRWEGLCTQYEN